MVMAEMILHDLTPTMSEIVAPIVTPADFYGCPAYRLTPSGMRSALGKLESRESTGSFGRLVPITSWIADQEPYERTHPGCDGHMYTKLVTAVGAGLTQVFSVWDGGFSVAINEDGTRAMILYNSRASR